VSTTARKDPYLEEAITLLDMHLDSADGDVELARSRLGSTEIAFIKDEVERCLDFRYYAENFHCIKSEDEGFKTLYPFWDSQEIFYEKLLKSREELGGAVRIVVLKARQLGMSSLSEAIIFHKCIFTEGCNVLVVAQDGKMSAYLFDMSRIAFDSLPWWLRPEKRYEEAGSQFVFDRRDAVQRQINPGLRSAFYVEPANKIAGVAVGRTYRAAHLSEVSSWPSGGDILFEQIFPTMNAPDTICIMESTARGRIGTFPEWWKKVSDGQIKNWRHVFLESFRVKKYSIPIPEGEKFELSDEEKSIRDKVKKEKSFDIPDEHFNWRRSKMAECEALQGDVYKFYQEFPSISSEEAFQSTGLCAFNKKTLLRILATTVAEPTSFGEIDLGFQKGRSVPVIRLTEAGDDVLNIPPQIYYGSRLYVWEQPVEGAKYYIGVDVARGNQGGNFSAAQVFRISHGRSPDVQVAEWRGWINPIPFASVIAALGYWYNTCDIAVEMNKFEDTATHLWRILEYPRVYRWKHHDKISGIFTNYFGWFTNVRTRNSLFTNFRNMLESNSVIIRSRHLIDECLDCVSDDETSERYEGLIDDRLFAAMISLYCAHEMDWGSERFKSMHDEASEETPEEMDARKKRDFFNTDFSPIHDQPGPKQDAFKRGVLAENIEFGDENPLGDPNVLSEKDWRSF
jgi:hypothetical protein